MLEGKKDIWQRQYRTHRDYPDGNDFSALIIGGLNVCGV
jgi:hypothetical protein